jgi:hypothetical protein
MRRKMTKDFSGRFLVRIPVTLHRTLAEQALTDRISLNQYVLFLLARGASLREFERFLKSMKDTTVEDLDTIIESDRLADTPRAKLRLMGLVMSDAKLEKPAGKMFLEGDLSVDVTEKQEVLEVDAKDVKVKNTYTATIKSKEKKEEIRFIANFLSDYLAMRPLSKELAKTLEKVRLAIYPSRVFRELLDRLITNLDLRVRIG